MIDKGYNGWSSYETWAVKLWMDNEESSYRYWQGAARVAWNVADDKHPNQFMNRHDNAQLILSDQLKDEHDSQSEHPVFAASDGTVYADLLNAALSDGNLREIANVLLDDAEPIEEEGNHATAT